LFKNVSRALATIAVIAAASTPVAGEEDFPIVGTYTKDQVCKGDGSDRVDLVVKITRANIQSALGFCTILSKRRDGRIISVQVECKIPGDLTILGDVTFKQRDDDALDFDDQDHTSPAVLYKCDTKTDLRPIATTPNDPG
jgi:hypothetical protein